MSSGHLSRHSFFPMENKIQTYAWGSTSSIHDLFGFENESQQPQSEVWMGTHPKGCSMVTFDKHLIPLSELINSNKSAYLSSDIAQEFGDLPFYLKFSPPIKRYQFKFIQAKAKQRKGLNKKNKQAFP